jgi:hypothetical protein
MGSRRGSPDLRVLSLGRRQLWSLRAGERERERERERESESERER